MLGRPEVKYAFISDHKDVFKKSRQTYGAPRVLHALMAQGYKIGKEAVTTFMRNLGLRPKIEFIHQEKFATEQQAKDSIMEWI